MAGVAENDLGEELTARKDRDETLDHARIFDEAVQKSLIPAFEETFEINQGTFRVRGGGERGLEMRFDGVEGFAKEGCEGVVHEGIILFTSRPDMSYPHHCQSGHLRGRGSRLIKVLRRHVRSYSLIIE